jgi:hypothetical protein
MNSLAGKLTSLTETTLKVIDLAAAAFTALFLVGLATTLF